MLHSFVSTLLVLFCYDENRRFRYRNFIQIVLVFPVTFQAEFGEIFTDRRTRTLSESFVSKIIIVDRVQMIVGIGGGKWRVVGMNWQGRYRAIALHNLGLPIRNKEMRVLARHICAAI
jgi:hypothetical protein